MKSKILLAFFLMSSFLFAQTEFLNKDSDLMLNGKKIGTIFVLTPVEVVSKNKDIAKVKIHGLLQENYKLLVVRSIKLGEKYVLFDDEKTSNIKQVKEVEDDYGEAWYEVEGEYEVKVSDLSDSKEKLYEKAKVVYQESCSACHRVHEPNSFTVNQWPANLASMIDAGYVSIDDESKSLIIKYLQQNAKDVK